jgi:hypothetical protein
MSAAKARDLMGIARFVRREDALRWGQEKSAADLRVERLSVAALATLARAVTTSRKPR